MHRVWQVSDPALIGKVLAMMGTKSLIIADGHHRYETSVAYRHERAAELGLASSETAAAPGATVSDPLAPPAFPEAAMMMTFVNMEAPGITILPTHRVVFGLSSFHGHTFAQQAERLFSVAELPSPADSSGSPARFLLQQLHSTPGVAFVAATREGNFLLTPRPEAVAQLAARLSPRQVALDVVQLHRLALEQLLQLDEDTVRAGNHVRYLREADEAVAEVLAGKADIAFLTKAVTLEQMKDISLNLEVMPQKSTDFYPKLLSGLAMYALD